MLDVDLSGEVVVFDVVAEERELLAGEQGGLGQGKGHKGRAWRVEG
jgi:hypothetical protein